MSTVRVVVGLALVAMMVAVVGVLPAAAASDPVGAAEVAAIAQEQGANGGTDVWTVVTWTLAAIVGSGLVLGVLYLLKRRVGGFPENPTWVAPITIMPAGENATEETFGLEADHHGGHGDDH